MLATSEQSDVQNGDAADNVQVELPGWESGDLVAYAEQTDWFKSTMHLEDKPDDDILLKLAEHKQNSIRRLRPLYRDH